MLLECIISVCSGCTGESKSILSYITSILLTPVKSLQECFPPKYILVRVKKPVEKYWRHRRPKLYTLKSSLSWVSSYSEHGDPFHRFKGTGNSEPQRKAVFSLKKSKIGVWVDKTDFLGFVFRENLSFTSWHRRCSSHISGWILAVGELYIFTNLTFPSHK